MLERVCRIALVSEELAFGKGAGGIGGAFHELALLLRQAGHAVDLIYLPIDPATRPDDAMTAYYADQGITIVDPDIERFTWAPFTYERRSYALFRHLIDRAEPYDFIHFHDYKGLGFHTLAAKSQQLGFADTTLVVQVHGPTRWTLEASDYPFTHEDQVKIDYMERSCIARADLLVSPSRYMIGWLERHGWAMPPPDRVSVIQNVASHLHRLLARSRPVAEPAPCNEIVCFARHEERKGLVLFCDTLDLLAEPLATAGVQVTLLGPLGTIHGEASALYLARRARGWRFPIRLLPDCDRLAAARYIAGNDRSVIVVPSRIENSPYTVLEAIVAGKPLITSIEGGAPELLAPDVAGALTCRMDRETLAARLSHALRHGLPAARPAMEPEHTARQWLDLHARPPALARSGQAGRKAPAVKRSAPKVVAGITHFQRPAKLYDAVLSLVGQLYPQLQIVVVDDGSRDPASLELLDRLAPLFDRFNVRLLRQANRYLGAARNHVIAETESDYVLFLDDDDIAFPNLVQTLVTAAEASGADLVAPLNLYMPEARRAEAHPFPERFRQKVSFVPLGGPLALAPLDNCFGSSTCLIRRSALRRIGGYTEDYGVGHEDYELYVRALQAGLRLEICPLPLFLYEVDRPSMITSTSGLRNWNRIARAIDLTQQPEAWRDMVTLTAGRRAQEHADNYARYRLTIDPQGELLGRIEQAATDSAEYAGLVATFATSHGAMSFAEALRNLVTARTPAAAKADAVLMPALNTAPPAPPPRPPETDPLILGALIDLSLDRIAQATDAFMLSWEREPGTLSAAQLRLLRGLSRHIALTAADAARLLQPLRRKSSDLKELEALTPTMFRLALHARDTQAAIGIIDRALVIDEQTYLALDPTLPGLIAGGAFASALDHLLRTGERDGKTSFQQLHGLRGALREELGVDVPITSLRQYVVALANGTPAQHATEAPLVARIVAPKLNGSANGSANGHGAHPSKPLRVTRPARPLA